MRNRDRKSEAETMAGLAIFALAVAPVIERGEGLPEATVDAFANKALLAARRFMVVAEALEVAADELEARAEQARRK